MCVSLQVKSIRQTQITNNGKNIALNAFKVFRLIFSKYRVASLVCRSANFHCYSEIFMKFFKSIIYHYYLLIRLIIITLCNSYTCIGSHILLLTMHILYVCKYAPMIAKDIVHCIKV